MIEEDAYQAHLGFSEPPRIRTLITRQYRLSVYGQTGHGALFDLREDPHEMRNLWSENRHAALKAELIEELAHIEMDLADRSPYPTYAA